MARTPLHYWTISSLTESFRKKRISPVEFTQHCLERIQALDPKLNAFKLVCPERALAQARAAETALSTGQDWGPLHGIPYAAKDLFDVRGLPTTAGCSLLEENVAQEDAAAIRRLIQAGMVFLGKTHTVQFAYSGIGINHDHGTPHNPWRPEPYVPGGSSSGSAVAISAGMTPAALGTDTGGSVRIPASLCGVVGLKTTVGRISRAGVYPLSWSLDSVGPMGRTVEDVALLYQALHGPDPGDESTLSRGPHDVLGNLKKGIRGLRLAFAETVFWEDIDPEVEKAVRACGEVFKELGAHMESISFPEAQEARALNPKGLIIAAEAYTINKRWVEEHFDRLDPVVASRIVRGKEISAPEYLQNSRDRQLLRRKAHDSLKDLEALLVPATMIPALPVHKVDESQEVYTRTNLAYLRNTSIGNTLDLCGLAIPCGFTGEGLPVGLMIYGKPFQEDVILRVGYAFQQATDWHERVPDLTWV